MRACRCTRYSDKYPFRMRSETPEIAIELSLQPWRAFKTDGVIFFSDILTPLPALGIEFDMIKGKGPAISNPVRRCGGLLWGGEGGGWPVRRTHGAGAHQYTVHSAQRIACMPCPPPPACAVCMGYMHGGRAFRWTSCGAMVEGFGAGCRAALCAALSG